MKTEGRFPRWLAITLVVFLPIFGVVFSSWYIPQLFNPKLKMSFPEYISQWFSGKMNYNMRENRPKAPGKKFAEGAVEAVDLQGKPFMDSVYHVIPNAKFETQSGDSLELDSLRGTIYVADFFFASCPGICPKMSNSLERVQEGFIKDDNFKIISFTVDPERDTVNVLRRYAGDHNAIPGKWYFLRHNKETVFKLAKDGFFVTAKDDEDGGPEAFVHSEKLVLVDGDGNIRNYYSGVDSLTVNAMMSDIVLLLRESEKKFNFSDQKKTSKKLLEK
ncbi:MAG TPA: SCO family protein [Chitinophagales bacterium]|nr:SCO family protein [Chitinophagales bacterium]